jgi:D,D-heptose 1,7-bisphosphate phosphatase
MVAVHKAVFLDRDGTIARDVPYCSRPEDFELLPEAAEGIRLLNESGYKVIVITNQSGIARGYFTEEMLKMIHQRMKTALARFGASIDGIYYCPHHPDNGCDCRKPKPGLALKAAQEHDIDLAESYFVGDKMHDVESGHAASCRTVLISPLGEVENSSADSPVRPDYIARNMAQASRLIIEKGEA